MSDIAEKSAPAINSFGAAVTKGKIGGDGQQVENIVTVIISGWRHLVAANLMQEMMDFASGVARASAHLLVSWTAPNEKSKSSSGEGDTSSTGGFPLVMDFCGYLKELWARAKEASLAKEGLKKKKSPPPRTPNR